MTTLASSSALKRACCTTWEHPAARLLLGEHLHPGGRSVTEAAIAATGVGAGGFLLDIGCGHGAALGMMSERGIAAIGIDLSADSARQATAHGHSLMGDGERLPFGGETLDGAIIQCVVSLFFDKTMALQDVHRVLKPGASLAISDVTLEGTLAPDLLGPGAWSCCLGGALPLAGYIEIIRDAGFDVIDTTDLSQALRASIEQVRRRLALFEISTTMSDLPLANLGLSPDLLERARGIAASLIEEVDRGTLGYASMVASKPA